MEEVSSLKNNAYASKKKHIYSRLLDYFAAFVATYIVFIISYSIAGNFPHMKRASEAYQDTAFKMAEYIGETHLQYYDKENKTLSDLEDGTKDYLVNLTKTSAYVHEIKYPVKQDDGTYKEIDVAREDTFIGDIGTYKLDNISYYFRKFKKSEASLNDYTYDGVDYKDDIDTYLYEKIMKLSTDPFISKDNPVYIARGEGAPIYIIFDEATTNKMINRIAKGETIDSGIEELYNSLYGKVGNTFQYGIDDLENNSKPYLALVDEFNSCYQTLVVHIFVVYLVSFVIAYTLLVVILRLIAKEWVTLGQKVLNLGMCRIDEMEIGVVRLIAYHFVNFVLYFSFSLISFYFFGLFGVFSLEIFPHFTLLAIALFSLTLTVISLFFPFFSKANHDFASFVTRIAVKDKGEFDVPVEMMYLEENSEKEVEEDGRTSEEN